MCNPMGAVGLPAPPRHPRTKLGRAVFWCIVAVQPGQCADDQIVIKLLFVMDKKALAQALLNPVSICRHSVLGRMAR